MRNANKEIVIVGAGITGCVLAYELSKAGKKVILIEKGHEVGGLARTFRYDGFTFDIGPHRFYTGDERVCSFIQEILEGEYDIIQRHSSVYFLGKYHGWPLNPWSMFNLPVNILLKSLYELLMVLPRKRGAPIDNFKDYIMKFYGPTLYNTFFRSYTQKFLNLSPEETHPDWAKEAIQRTIIDERMASRNLWEILRMSLLFFPLKTEFLYPKKGIDVFCKRLVEKAQARGAQIHVNACLDKVFYSEGQINGVVFNQHRVDVDRLFWTGDLHSICRLTDVPIEGLDYLDLIQFNVLLKKPVKKDFQWCYYGSDDLIFSRITIPSRFSPDMAPQGRESLCVEVTCHKEDACWRNPETLIERVRKDLLRVGLVEEESDIDVVYFEKISHAYPIYTKNYPQHLSRVMDSFSEFRNLILAGRTGTFWYNNMDDSIENGLDLVSNIVTER